MREEQEIRAEYTRQEEDSFHCFQITLLYNNPGNAKRTSWKRLETKNPIMCLTTKSIYNRSFVGKQTNKHKE